VPVDIAQISFAGGEVSPSTYARIDLQKFGSSAKELTNYFVHAEGGISNRAGTEFIVEVKDSSQTVRNVPFEFNEEQAYSLEFGDQYMRVIRNGGLVLEASQVISGATQANPVVVTSTGHTLLDGEEVYIAGVVGMTELNGKYFTVANKTANTFELSGIDGTAYTAYTSGGTVSKVFELATPYLQTELAALKFRQSNDIMYLAHRNHAPRKLGRTGHAAWTLTTITFEPEQAFPTGLSVTVNTTGTETDRYKVTAVASETSEESLTATGVTQAISGATQANPVVLTLTGHPYLDGDEIHVSGIVGMTELNDRRFIIANKTANTVELKDEDGTGYTAYSSAGSADLTHYIVTNSAVATDNTITFNETVGAASYNIYKADNGLFGFIGRTEELSFTDNNKAPDLNDTAPKWRDPFGSATNYPGAVGLHEQRSVWGNTDNKPLTTDMSQAGQFENMNVSSPTKEADAVSFRLITGQGNEIRHYRSFADQLFVFTSGALWTVQPGGNVDAITSASKKVSVSAYISSTDTPPITIKQNILMVSGKQNAGFEVHSLGFDLQTDGYKGSDLTVLARHLFENKTISEWAYSERPYRLLVCVRSDGKLLVMTYLEEHQVFAWSVWETDGTFESVSSVPEGQEDVFYFVVKRNINGNDVKYIERMHSRDFTLIEDAFFVDCGLTYEGVATSTITGLDHLEGEDVIALADGNLVTSSYESATMTVTNGAIDIGNAAAKVHVGLPYTGTFESLPLNTSTQQGPTIAKNKVPKEVVLRVQDTRGIFVGSDVNDLQEYATRTTELWGDPAAILNEVIKIPIPGDWEKENGVVVQSEPGLPQTILSITANTNIGG